MNAIATLAAAGIRGNDATTTIRLMQQRITYPTPTAADTISRLNVSTLDSHGRVVDVETFLLRLGATLAGRPDTERHTAMVAIFGADATRAATVLCSPGAQQ